MTAQASKLRILHVIARLNVGGAAKHVLELASLQRTRGHDVLVAAGTIPAGEVSMEYLASRLDVPIHRVGPLQRDLSARRDAAAIRELRRLFRELRPDVLHTHTAKAGATARIAALAAGDARPPALVHTYHGHVLRGYFDPVREGIFRRVERSLAKRTDALVAVSAEVRDELVALGVASSDRFVVVPYGFDLSRGDDATTRAKLREELGVDEGAFVVGWAGRMTAIKRPDDLVRTMRDLVSSDVDARLVVVGDGPDRAATERLAESLGVSERCVFLGYRTDVADWYAAFDAFLLVSANEGTPVAAIEALAAARPVVATDAGGMATVVRDGESGFLTAIGDTAGLADRLAVLARDPDLRARLGRRGAADVRVRFALEPMADALDELYSRLLAG